MGFQNENKLKVGASVKATINNKVVEAKVINIGFNRVTLRSQKGNEATYAFNSEKFLKWFKEVPLNEVANNHAEKSDSDLLKGVKIVTSGPSVKERTTTPKEKESKFKLDFDFPDDTNSPFMVFANAYANEIKKQKTWFVILSDELWWNGVSSEFDYHSFALFYGGFKTP
ncbi:hypothetical protein HpMS86_14970 [Helicobacter pylori]